MIAKQTKGRGFRGTLNYILMKEGAEIVGGNMLGETPRELAAEFAESRKLRPNLDRAVYHASLSLPAGERLSDEKWATVSEQYVTKMGFEKSQYIVTRHTDTEHDHIHIIASRIALDGRYVSDSNDYKRSEEIVRGLEKEHDLTRVIPSQEIERRAPTRGELEMAEKGIVSIKLQLQDLIDAAITDKPTMSQFIKRMNATDVGVNPNIAKTGHISGISFMLDDEQMKGSDLGKGYTWLGLQKRGVDYDQERDSEAISRAKEQAKVRESERDHRELEQDRFKESRGIDRENSDFSVSDGSGYGLDKSHDDGTDDDGEDDNEGNRQRDGKSEESSKDDRNPSGEDNPQDLDHDDSGGVPHIRDRSQQLRTLASTLRAFSGGGISVERVQEPSPKLEPVPEKRTLKNLGLGSKEIDKLERDQEVPLEKPLEKKKHQKKKDPFSLDVSREREIAPPKKGWGRDDDDGPDFFGI